MYYCTLFNSYYLSRGLALYHSLLKNAKQFHLYIFTLDDAAYQILKKLELPNVSLISLAEFETAELLAVKPHRTVAEYCWTCTAVTTLHCLEKFNLPHVCYLDADLFFWEDPAILLEEAQNYSVLITEHRYTPQYDQSVLSGKYCVQFMYFKNDNDGLTALKWWRDACIAWCYNRAEEGKFGDQKYLDDWPERFSNVKVLQHLGGGVAPWNVQQYELIAVTLKGSITLREIKTSREFNLIFYHFHGVKFINNTLEFSWYKLSANIINHLYKPYVYQLLQEAKLLEQLPAVAEQIKQSNIHGKSLQQTTLREILRNIKRKFLGIYNVYSIEEFGK